jgi:hypothetical protein
MASSTRPRRLLMSAAERKKLTTLIEAATVPSEEADRAHMGLAGLFGKYPRKMLTAVGPFFIDLQEDGDNLFCRFADPKRAAAVLAGVNPHSGKFNFYVRHRGQTAADLWAGVLSSIQLVYPVHA